MRDFYRRNGYPIRRPSRGPAISRAQLEWAVGREEELLRAAREGGCPAAIARAENAVYWAKRQLAEQS